MKCISRRRHGQNRILGLFLGLTTASIWAQVVMKEAPVNPEFIAWQREQATQALLQPQSSLGSARTNHLGYTPSPLDLSHITGPVFAASSGMMATAPSIPATYDLRALGQLTGIRDQGPYNDCWSFAAIASLESSQLKGGRGTFNLSEWHLAWYAYNDFSPTFAAFTKGAPAYGSDETFDQGGNNTRSTAILARGTGAVAEADCPYQNTKPYPIGSLPKGIEPATVCLREALYLGSGYNPTDIKTAVMTYGAVSTPIYWSDNNYGSANSTYRYTTTGTTNHLVNIVGWNDAYPATNFPVTNRPATNGAWIVRNSWGSSWGDSGYFYMSYDTYVNSGVAFVSDSVNYRRIYQYDFLGWVGNSGYGTNTAWFSNVFTAAVRENISAVSFYAAAANASYEISIRTGVTGDPASGTLIYGPQAGTLDAPGYRRVFLSNPVPVPNGGKFAVIVKLTTPGSNYPIPTESPVAGYSGKATANAGESYISASGASWTDTTSLTANRNVCLKAFATAATVRQDFTGNGTSDLLWRNNATGAVYLMPMAAGVVQPGTVIYSEPNPAWQIVGTGDFDGDGKADILWWNSQTGQVYQMLMNGTAIKSAAMIYTEPNTAWTIQAVADFTGDGKADILWRNASTGAAYLMPMNGAAVLPGGVIWTEPNPAWQIVAADDFNGDGKSEILWWNNQTGQVCQMQVNGTASASGSIIYTEPNTAWRIIGTGDFNGDGKADILWRNTTTGAVYQMPMNGSTVLAGSIIYTEPNQAWQIQAVGDFDGDGKADILWRNISTGQVYQMLMNGLAIKSSGMVYTEPNLAWTIQSR